MYKQKLTLDPKLAEICGATLTVRDAEALQQETLEKAANFKVLGCSKLSEQEMSAHKLMRVAVPLATGERDVAITEIKCISIDGDTLPAEFQLNYEFHVANYSDEAIASVPVTIYFNTPDHALVEQGTTTITNIPAGHYQALEFTFPPVQAGNWVMSLEANKPRAFVESNYNYNLLSKTFTYVNQAELEAVSVSCDDAIDGSDGEKYLIPDEEVSLMFQMNNIGSATASNVLVQIPAAFQDDTGAYGTILAESRMDIPAHTARTVMLNITFTKQALAQIGLLLNNDRSCSELSYDNNEVHTQFVIGKPNPSTGPDPEPDGEQKLIFPFKEQYVSTGYKDDAPAYEYGYSYGPHYGIDMYANGDTNVYASGYGEIVDTEEFNSLGNVLAVKYTDVLDHDGKNIGPIILRYCHLASIEKDSGFVKPGDKIAVQGASGTGARDENWNPVYHLHLEADTDTTYPSSTPSEGGGVDTTIDPLNILYKTKEQVVEPDCEDGKSGVDEEGRPWYDIDKITSIPVI